MFFDIGMGLLLTTFVGVTTGTEFSWLLLCVGVTGSLWPDLDFIIWVLRGNKIDHLVHRHRDLLHRPLVLTPLLSGAVWWWLGPQAGVLCALATLTHIAHDGIGQGWGILLFWPIDSRYYCYRSYGNCPAQLYVWTRAEQDQLCNEYGDRQWAKRVYGRLSPALKGELAVLATGALAAVLWRLSTP